MIKNYLKTAIRILLRQKAYSAINIFGLTIGLASSLLIILYIVDDLSYDRFQTNPDRIYRVGFKGRLQGNEFSAATSPAPLAEAMKNEIPQVESAVRIGYWRTFPIRIEEKSFTEKKLILADSNFFDFFNFKLIQGNAKDALRGPNKVVITEEAARKYFGYKGAGDTSPLGKTLILGSQGEITGLVTGIAADPPANSHFHFNILLSIDSWDYIKQGQWTSNNLYTYFRTYPKADMGAVKAKLDNFVDQYMGVEIEKYLGLTMKQFREQGSDIGFFLQPLLDIHLRSNFTEELEPNSNITYLYLFGAVSLFIILIACINFMNLSTARSANRAKEVGVRKTIGALRIRLVGQFLIESYLYTFISVILALLVIYLVLGPFNLLTGKELHFSLLGNPSLITGIAGLTLLVGLLAGSYPAFYLTSFKPVDVLKGKIRSGMKSSGLRNFMVIAQFTISIGLIISTLVVYRQLHYVQEKNLGFDKENVLNVLHTRNLGSNALALKNELLKHPEFTGVSYSNNLPPNINWNTVFRLKGTDLDHLLSIYEMDYDHLKTLGYTMEKGRFFSRDFPSDSNAIILNEAAAAQFGITTVDGQLIMAPGNDPGHYMELIGIIKDFNFESLHNKIKPMAVRLGREPNYEMAIRFTPGKAAEKVKIVEGIWKKLAPQAPFEYSFLDQNFDALFRAEQRLGQVILIFTVLTILIACLGLFGLATFTAEQRAKEISIRKVMGASLSQLVFLMSKDFSRLVIIAFIMAIPISLYMMNQWLDGFAYRVSIGVMLVIFSGVSALAVALLTISFQSIRAALSNPVNALKNE